MRGQRYNCEQGCFEKSKKKSCLERIFESNNGTECERICGRLKRRPLRSEDTSNSELEKNNRFLFQISFKQHVVYKLIEFLEFRNI